MGRRNHQGGGVGSNQYGSRGSRKRKSRGASSAYQTEEALNATSRQRERKRFQESLLAQASDNWTEPESKRVSTNTPWGQADFSHQFGRGVVQYTCPGHGGFSVSPGVVGTMHPSLVSVGEEKGGRVWFEEDGDWAALAVAKPSLFSRSSVELAIRMMKDHEPDKWSEFSGEEVDLSESSTLRERQFIVDNEGGYVSNVTFHEPEGDVEVTFAPVRDGCRGHAEVTVAMDGSEYTERMEASLGHGSFGFEPERDEQRIVNSVRTGIAAKDVDSLPEARVWLEENPDAPRIESSFYDLKKGRLFTVSSGDGSTLGYLAKPKKTRTPSLSSSSPSASLSEVLYEPDRDGDLMTAAEVRDRFQARVPVTVNG